MCIDAKSRELLWGRLDVGNSARTAADCSRRGKGEETGSRREELRHRTRKKFVGVSC
jgi:hypothetical protein